MRLGELRFQASPGEKRSRDHHLNGKKLGVVVLTSHPSDGRKLKTGGLRSRPAWEKS
jgi:hypothetical protein